MDSAEIHTVRAPASAWLSFRSAPASGQETTRPGSSHPCSRVVLFATAGNLGLPSDTLAALCDWLAHDSASLVGRDGLRDEQKVFCLHPKRGEDIDAATGCMVVVRPDQQVGHGLPLQARQELADDFAGTLRVRGGWRVRSGRMAPVTRLGKPSHDPPGACTLRAMLDWSTCPAVERDPASVSGAWVFRGTRVPVAALFENLEDDVTAHQFVAWFPGVSMEQVRAVLEHAARSSLAIA